MNPPPPRLKLRSMSQTSAWSCASVSFGRVDHSMSALFQKPMRVPEGTNDELGDMFQEYLPEGR
jgi:hypothetical protein